MRSILLLSITAMAACANNTDVTIDMVSETSQQGANASTEPISHIPVIMPGTKCGVIHRSGSQAEMLKELNDAISDSFTCCQLE